MGAQEATETSKAPNKTPNAQETPPMPGPYAEWMGYYPVPHHMWSGQPIMPAYPIYPGVYGHPPYGQQFGMASPSSGNEGTAATTDAEAKSENKGRRSRLRTSKGGSYSGGGESESDRSSNEEKDKKSQSQEPAADASSAFNLPLTPTKSAAGSWDYFAGVGPNGAPVPPAKRGAPSSVAPPLPIPRDATELDERELKRQRRKQSNRESARRSRQRKQAECEELAQRVETYTMDNLNLRAELEKVRAELKLLTEQNALYKKQLAEKQIEQAESETNPPEELKSDTPKLQQPSSEAVTA